MDFNSPLDTQISSIEATDLYWIESIEAFDEAMILLKSELKQHCLLAVDLEYHNADPE